MVSVGKTEEGRPIVKMLKPEAFFATYNDAYAALVEYHRNPYDLQETLTVKELYERWSELYYSKISPSTARGFRAAWSYCEEIYEVKVPDLRARHIRGCIEKEIPPYAKKKIKLLFSLLMDYAIEYELTDKNYARSIDISKEISPEDFLTKKEHIDFTSEEMATLWQNINDPVVDMILIQCYSGWRPQELCKIKLDDVNINEMTFTGGMKTKAGKNRMVPIHSKIQELVVKYYNKSKLTGSEYLFSFEGREITYHMYLRFYTKAIKDLGLNQAHRPHDPRVQFVTSAKKYNVDEMAIKHFVGHTITDITEKVYTKRTLDWYRSEMEKIK